MAKIKILNRWNAAVLFEAEISDDVEPRFRMRAAVELAVSKRANLSAADLSYTDLSYTDLSYTDLSYADLSYTNLRGAKNLAYANLSYANLRGAKNLAYDQLIQVRDDLWAVLSAAPKEVAGLRQALVEGRVDGSTYKGACACLVGTIANVRHTSVHELGFLKPDSDRPIERWFLGIKKGDTPDSNVCAKFALQWLDEWMENITAAFGGAA